MWIECDEGNHWVNLDQARVIWFRPDMCIVGFGTRRESLVELKKKETRQRLVAYMQEQSKFGDRTHE